MLREDLAKLVNYTFRRLLERDAGDAALEVWVTHLADGGSLAALEEKLSASEEFKKLNRAKHPLSDYPFHNAKNSPHYSHRGLFRPLALTVETVNICNNDCIFCPYSLQTRKKQAMPMATFEKVLRAYEEIGGGQIALTPMVGEIFLDKMLLQRLALLDQSPFIENISATSNASALNHLNDEYLKKALQHFDALKISVYGLDREEYLQITRKDQYNDMLEGAARLLRIGGPAKVDIACRQLKDRNEEFYQSWLKDLADMAGIDWQEIRCTLGMLQYSNWSVLDTDVPLPHDATWMPKPALKGQCGIPLAAMRVYSNGDISICSCADYDSNSELQIGNINQSTFREALQSERARELWNWDEFGVPKFCRGCTFYRPMDMFTKRSKMFSDPLMTINGHNSHKAREKPAKTASA